MNKNNLLKCLQEVSGREVRRFLSRHSIKFFAKYYLGVELYPHHLKWLAIACDFMINRRALILAPKDHGKSWALAYIYALWRICFDLDMWIIVASNTASQAEMHARLVIFQLENNGKLIRDFALPDIDGIPRFRAKNSEKWTDQEIIVNRQIKSEHATLIAVGSGAAVLGRRAKLLIGDDLLDKDNSFTAGQREKTKYWHDNEYLNTLEPDGQEIVIGTAQHDLDLYSDLAKRKMFVVVIDKAVINAETKAVLWPEKWSFDALMDRKDEIGTIAFNMNYQNEPMSDETSWFPYKWIARCFDDEATFVDSRRGLETFKISAGADLAISEEAGADYFVTFVLGVDRLGNHWILNIYRDKIPFPTQCAKVVDTANAFDPLVIQVENNNYQRALQQAVVKKTDVPIRGFTTTFASKESVETGIRSLSVLVENGKLKIPRGDQESIELTDVFVNELQRVGKGHTGDTVMAWWFAEGGIKRFLKEARTTNAIV